MSFNNPDSFKLIREDILDKLKLTYELEQTIKELNFKKIYVSLSTQFTNRVNNLIIKIAKKSEFKSYEFIETLKKESRLYQKDKFNIISNDSFVVVTNNWNDISLKYNNEYYYENLTSDEFEYNLHHKYLKLNGDNNIYNGDKILGRNENNSLCIGDHIYNYILYAHKLDEETGEYNIHFDIDVLTEIHYYLRYILNHPHVFEKV